MPQQYKVCGVTLCAPNSPERPGSMMHSGSWCCPDVARCCSLSVDSPTHSSQLRVSTSKHNVESTPCSTLTQLDTCGVFLCACTPSVSALKINVRLFVTTSNFSSATQVTEVMHAVEIIPLEYISWNNHSQCETDARRNM